MPLYLNIIWHQHQPLYLDPATDQLQGPWVRTHGTKDYYDMAAVVQKYPKIHCNINLTSSLVFQLEEYYVNRLRPFVDTRRRNVNARGFLRKYGGKTDPWIDLALKPTSQFSEKDKHFLLTNTWNAFGISEVMFERFPQYADLRRKFREHGVDGLTEQDLREIKFWFYLASFDPDFLESKVKLVTGLTVDVAGYIERENGVYRLRKSIEEKDCNRIVAETYMVLSAIIPIHKKLLFHPGTRKGQVEVVTTPYYHPILPLLYDSDLAKVCQPNDPMPSRFFYPADAEAQVARAISYYKSIFGIVPSGMWPAEGSVAHDIASVFQKHKINWIATDERILARSKPENQPKYFPYIVQQNHDHEDPVVIVFRDTDLSDRIGFEYKEWKGSDAAEDFVRRVLQYAPEQDAEDRLLTVILDGENAWEWYRLDYDGKEFQNSLYAKLSELYEKKQVITVTTTEYLLGNAERGVPPHPPDSMRKLDWLYPGSWINANYDTWIGEEEENRAWEYLREARKDLGVSGIAAPAPGDAPPKKGSKAWYTYKAWDSLYAAEGSDWFWWYGTDQTAPAGDKPFDLAYITLLNNIYAFAKKAGGKIPSKKFHPIIRNEASLARAGGGTMAQSVQDLVKVVFQCDANGIYVRKSISIAGNIEQLGSWTPNKMRMYDDGSHGDLQAGDNVWTKEVFVPSMTEIEYKFTNSGALGVWNPGEEFPQESRRITVDKKPGEVLILKDRFGTK